MSFFGRLRRACGDARLLAPVLLVLGLAVHPPARAQLALMFWLGLELGSALPFLVRGTAFEMTATEAARVAEYQRRGDWEGLARLATQRMEGTPQAQGPDSVSPDAPAAAVAAVPPEAATRAFWLVVRGGARQHELDCPRAIADYAAAATIAGDLPVADLNRALCEMALGQYDAAERTLDRLTRHAELMWDARYNLGVVRAVKGDLPGAQAAVDALRELNPVLAKLLDSEFVEPLRSPGGATEAAEPAAAPVTLPPPTSSDLSSATVPGLLADGTMAIEGRRLRLPPGQWVLVSNALVTFKVDRPSTTFQPYSGEFTADPPERTGIAVAMGTAGAVATVVYRSHPPVPRLLQYPAPARRGEVPSALCATASALYFREDRGREGCLHVARVVPFLEGDVPLFELPMRLWGTTRAQPPSMPPPWARQRPHYEVTYAGYSGSTFASAGPGRFVSVSVLVPLGAFAGDVAAARWAARFADEMHRLTDDKVIEVVIPWPDRWDAVRGQRPKPP